jgi:hypothetical protein
MKAAKILAVTLMLSAGGTAYADVTEIHRTGPTCDAEFRACTLVVRIGGMITDQTVDQINAIVDKTRQQAEKNGYSFAFLQVDLNSRGGTVDAALAIGRILRKEQTAAVVNRGAICLSACVLVLAGGSYRGLEGTIGIHRPYLPVPNEEVSAAGIRVSYQTMLEKIRSYFREMNIAEGLADAMLRISPENMHVLTPAELNQHGLLEIDPVTAEESDLTQARYYGLDRQEYMRRKLLAEAQCGGPGSLGTGCYKSIMKNGYFEQPDFSQFGRER